MELRLLGPVEAIHEGRRIPLGAAKQRALLAMLALRPNAVVPVESLVDGVWGDAPPATAPKMVQLYVSQLRKLLEGTDAEIVTRGRGYELRIAEDAVDAVRFERLVEAGEARAALQVWGNGSAALADLSGEPFAADEARRLEELRLRAAELAADADLAVGRHSEVADRLEPLVRANPLREGLHERRMLALYRSGRQAEALAAFRDAREVLVEEVGVEPGPALRDLHERMLRQDPSLGLAAVAPAAAPAPGTATFEASPPRARRRLLVVALAALALGGGVFGVSRVTGPDGLDRIDEGAVGVVEGDGSIAAQYRLGPEPGAIASGAGSTWVAHPATETVSRIRRDENRVDTIEVGSSPVALAFVAGSIWVGTAEGTVTRVDPSTNRVEQRVPVGNGLRALAGGFGSLWAAAAVDGAVVRIDPRTARVTGGVLVGGHPSALAVGAGSVWAVAEDAPALVRIDPRAPAGIQSITVGHGPAAVAFAGGAAWVANRDDGTVSRVDPATDRVSHTLPAGRQPVALAAAGGALWIGDVRGEIRRLDPGTREIGRTLRTGSTPSAMAEVDGELWATGAPSLRSHRGGTLRASVGDVVDLDPATGGIASGSTPFVDLVHEGLVEHRRTGGGAAVQVVPGLAASVPEPEDGGRRYTFRLRPGLRYSDGSPVRAGDFVATAERLRKTENAFVFDGLEIDADDAAGTVEVRVQRPDPELLYKLSLPVHGLVKPGSDPPLGTGPYRVAGRDALERNPHFRPRLPGGRPDGFPDRIVHVPVASFDEGAGAVERGELDVYLPGPSDPADVTALQTRIGGRLRADLGAGTVLAYLNTAAPPLDDRRVRTAINLAVDRGHVARLTGGADLAAVQCQLLPPGMLGYRPICPFTAAPTPVEAWVGPDRDRALSLVAASGTAGRTVEVLTTPERRGIGRHLASVLRDLGYRARLTELEHEGEVFEAMLAPDAGAFIAVGGWIAANPAPARFLRELVGCEPPNVARFCDRALDRMIDRAEALGDTPGDAWERIERRIARAAPLVPLHTLRFPVALSARAGNVQFRPVTGVLLDQIWVR